MRRPSRPVNLLSIALALALACGDSLALRAGDVFLRGDGNGDGLVNFADVAYLVNREFFGGPPPPCERAADANGDGAVDLSTGGQTSDLLYLIAWLLFEGPSPPAPFPDLGLDPNPAPGLSCDGAGDPPPVAGSGYALTWTGPPVTVPGAKDVEFFLRASSPKAIEGFSAAYRFAPEVLTNLRFDLEGTVFPEDVRDALAQSPFARLEVVREPFGPNDAEVDQLFFAVLFVVEAQANGLARGAEADGGGAEADGGGAGSAFERLAVGSEAPFRDLPFLRMTADIRADAPANTLIGIILPLRPDDLPEGGLRLNVILSGALGLDVDPFATARPIALGEAGEILFKRGDYDGSDELDLSDAVSTFSYLFLGAAPPACLDAADTDDNGTIELTDGVRTLNFLFLGGPEPAFPGVRGGCGLDPSPDFLLVCGETACGRLSAP